MVYASAVLAAVCASWLLTRAMRRVAINARLIDEPNARSSHQIPTPRGGGVAIVATFLLLTLCLGATGRIDVPLTLAIVGSGALVATLGFIDDLGHVSARWRFLGHAVAAAWALAWMGGLPTVPIFGHAVDLGWFGLALSLVYLVWMVNLYNFMDGIDGIAGIEAVTVSLGGALCWWLADATPLWFVPVVFAAAAAGFLFWNYPPAKIFMGDSGSGFIGMVLGLLSLWSGHQAPPVFWCWFILLGCFMVDATTTLVRRVRRGERFSVAHRSHAYQYASRLWGSHKRVSLSVGAINVLWLLPIAVLVASSRLDGVTGAIIAYAPLVVLAFRLKAGDRASQDRHA